MKKSKFTLFMVIAFTSLLFNVKALAATSIGISASSSVTVGNTVTATVTISSNSTLGTWDFVIGYDTSKLTLLDDANQRIADFGDGKIKSRSYTFRFMTKATGSAKIYVDSASYYSYWDEKLENVSKGSKTITINPKKVSNPTTYSSNNYLSSLGIDGYELTPAFNKNTLEYSVKLPKETYNIKLNGKTEDSKAKIDGIGDITLVDGENKLEVKVTAENGNIRTYVIKATVEEPNPIKVNIDEKEYTVVRKKDGLTIPSNYKETTIDIQGESVLAFNGEITKYNLVALKDNEGNIGLYIYNSTNETYELYKELKFNSINIYPYLISDDKILDGYKKGKMTINNNEVEVLQNKSGYPIIYGMNLSTGEVSYYTYDAKDNTLQRYNEEEVLKNNKENKDKLYIIYGLAAFSILELFIIIIILAVKNKKTNKKLEETLEKTMKFAPIDEDNIEEKSKKEIKKEEKQKLKEEKLKKKEEKKKLKEKNKDDDYEDMDEF